MTLGFWAAGYSHWEYSAPTPHRYRETALTASLSTLVFFITPYASGRFVGRRLACRYVDIKSAASAMYNKTKYNNRPRYKARG